MAIKEYLPADLTMREQDMSVLPKSSRDEEDLHWGLDRFLEEARVMARFKHPNILQVQHFFQAHGTAYIVMEYVEGETLSGFFKCRPEPVMTDGLHLPEGHGWGWYYLSTVLDDNYARFILAWRLCTGMAARDVTDTLHAALDFTGLEQATVKHRPRLLSDNGSGIVRRVTGLA